MSLSDELDLNDIWLDIQNPVDFSCDSASTCDGKLRDSAANPIPTAHITRAISITSGSEYGSCTTFLHNILRPLFIARSMCPVNQVRRLENGVMHQAIKNTLSIHLSR